MTIIFNYKTVKRPDGTKVKTPSIPILLSEKEKIETVALLDSGADISAVPKDIAEILGLDLRKKHTPAFGIGGRTDAVDTTMKITISKGHEIYNFRIPVKVILGNYDFPVLLGRAGFFDKFVISFNQIQEKVSLKRYIKQ
ncbi:retropepsin-like aspartic protease [Nanoarchaeota archaeon]